MLQTSLSSQPLPSIISQLSSHRGFGWCKRPEHVCVIQSSPPTVVLSRGVHTTTYPQPCSSFEASSHALSSRPQPLEVCWKAWLPVRNLLHSIFNQSCNTKIFFSSTVNESEGSECTFHFGCRVCKHSHTSSSYQAQQCFYCAKCQHQCGKMCTLKG